MQVRTAIINAPACRIGTVPVYRRSRVVHGSIEKLDADISCTSSRSMNSREFDYRPSMRPAESSNLRW